MNEDGERGSEQRRFDELQAARGDVRFLRKLLLRQPRLLAQPPEVPAQGFELLLSNALHRRHPTLRLTGRSGG